MPTYKNASTYYIIVELEILEWYLATNSYDFRGVSHTVERGNSG